MATGTSLAADAVIFDHESLSQIPYMQFLESDVVAGAFLVILILGVLGNAAVIVSLLLGFKLKNSSDIYMLSMSLGDIMVRKDRICIYYL